MRSNTKAQTKSIKNTQNDIHTQKNRPLDVLTNRTVSSFYCGTTLIRNGAVFTADISISSGQCKHNFCLPWKGSIGNTITLSIYERLCRERSIPETQEALPKPAVPSFFKGTKLTGMKVIKTGLCTPCKGKCYHPCPPPHPSLVPPEIISSQRQERIDSSRM